MTKQYDVLVVGAGPAGMLAARSVAENGFDVALLERKPNLTTLDRASGGSLLSANEYLHHDLYRCNLRGNRISFPAHGFSVKYDGPYKNVYASHFYSPSGYRVEAGVVVEQKKKGDYGKVTTRLDLEILLRCFLEEAQACSVDVFPGINVQKVTPVADGVTVEGSGQAYKARYLIAADGVNSRIAEQMGFNKERTYYCQLRAISRYVSGLEPPVPEIGRAHV